MYPKYHTDRSSINEDIRGGGPNEPPLGRTTPQKGRPE